MSQAMKRKTVFRTDMQIRKKLMKQIRRIIFPDVPVDFAWKQPVRWTVHFPVFPKCQQALLRQLDISAFSPFGMDNMKKHSFRVNISDPQSGDFRSSQAAVISKIDHSSETDIGRT
jgi:hypothetical protein